MEYKTMRHLAESCLSDFKCIECQLKEYLASGKINTGPHTSQVLSGSFFLLFLQPSQHFAFWPAQMCCQYTFYFWK